MGSAVLSCAGGDEYDYHQQAQYFLQACNLCHKPLGHNSDIFMYRGNTPFCSEECRQEQIEIDEDKEKSWKNSKRALRQTTNDSTNKESTPSKAARRGTVAVA